MFDTPRYEVTGTQPVLGHLPGSFFEADLDPVMEQRLISARAITPVAKPAAPEPPVRLDDPQPDPEPEGEVDG